jgi:hypothetical protein
MSSLPPEERAKIRGLQRVPTHKDIVAFDSDDEHDHPQTHPETHHYPHDYPSLPPRPTAEPSGGIHCFGRRLKDKLTNTTHEERERMRQQRAKEEQEAYERHLMYRQAMARAMETGQPQFIGKDKEGKDVYIEPPEGYGPAGGYGAGPGGYVGYNPYTQGPYANPNARFVRPQAPYSRPYYGGYGGGMGVPLGLGLGLGGGLLASSLFF